ncbi:MAG: hypothetical protein HC850_09795 [Rhodomicrobium sp.]|nr:hypothetical protein [Rhodomicrobium sp.]
MGLGSDTNHGDFSIIAIVGDVEHFQPLEILSMAVALGIVTGGIGITYAHELMHQTNRFERALSEILMTSTLYGHFCIEHVYGHHIHVGTPKDPVSAEENQSFYAFYPRAVFGSLLSAWQIQRARMVRRNKPVWHLSNPFWRYGLAYVVYFSTAYAWRAGSAPACLRYRPWSGLRCLRLSTMSSITG